jgi:HK97 family phage major capsid protein
MPTSVELARELERKRAELHKLFDEKKAGTDPVDGGYVFEGGADLPAEVKRRNDELASLNDQFQQVRLREIREQNLEEMKGLREVERRYAQPGNDGGRARRDVKLSDLIVEHDAFKARGLNKGKFSVEFDDVDVKTLMDTTNGYAPPNNMGPRVVLSAQRRPVAADVIPSSPTNDTLIRWMEETTFTNNASTVSEAGLKAESALKYTEKNAAVEVIAAWLPVTRQQLDDINGIRNLIDNRLTLMLLLSEENQILNGGGTSPDLDGFFHKTGVQSRALAAGENNADALYMAGSLVRNTGMAEPSAYIMNPNNWDPIRLMKTTTGEYIYGPPSVDVDARVWGKPVVVTQACPGGSGLAGDFPMYSHISRKMGVTIDVSDSHSDYFVYNKLAIRIEERLSLEIYRPAAFCKATGLL